MARLKGAASSFAAVLLWCATAHAQIGGNPIEASGGAGWSEPDSRSHVKSGGAYTGSLGYRFTPSFSIEAQGTWLPSEIDNGDSKRNFSMLGLDGRLNFRPADNRIVPFLLGGFGYGVSHDENASPTKLERGSPTLGLGLLWNVSSPRLYLRVQVRDILFRERDADEYSNYMMATAGLQYVFGGKPKDQDLDGVRDWLDVCPNTTIGARVDTRGCPTDADGDSVFDGIDQCDRTPAGCAVDAKGCPSDADGDGVCDGVDKCADTPKGARVDVAGCPMDTDGDGVVDGIDQCEATAKGCKVDERGCPSDADGDGVCDGMDQCPNTPAGARVDPNGCPVDVSEKETQLLETGTIRLQNVEFETGKASLKAVSFVALDEVGTILQQYPTLQVEIGGHTDNRGKAAANLKLSQARADSVLAYMKTRYPITASQLTAKGYGLTAPVAPNTSDAGRARNRRVEFKVLNPDVLRSEREKRRPAGGGAPADTTRH